MSKTYKGYELIKAIVDGEIKEGTKIEIKGRFSGDLIGSYFIYNKGAFNFFIYKPDGTEYDGKVELHDIIDYTFELIEDNKIDIESIEELRYETIIETLGAPDCFNGNELYCLRTFSKNDENLLHSNAENHKKINELVQAVKQLNREIKELKEKKQC